MPHINFPYKKQILISLFGLLIGFLLILSNEIDFNNNIININWQKLLVNSIFLVQCFFLLLYFIKISPSKFNFVIIFSLFLIYQLTNLRFEIFLLIIIFTFSVLLILNSKNLKEFTIVIVCYIFVNLILFESISFYSGTVFESMTGRLDAYQPLIANYLENYKHGNIFNNLIQKSNFGSEIYYPLSNSLIFNIICLINEFVFGELSYLNLFNSIKSFTFLLISINSLGVYVLFRVAFNKDICLSFFAGLLSIYGNPTFIGYQGNENYHQLSEYILMPYSILSLFFGINRKRKELIFLSGFILGSSILIMRSSFEFRIISILFICFLLTLFYIYKIQKINFLDFKNVFIYILLLILGYFFGSINDLIPLISGIINGDISIFQPHNFYGLNWEPKYFKLSSIFYQYSKEFVYFNYPNEVGRNVGFYKGPIFSILTIFFIIYFLWNIKKILKSNIAIFIISMLLIFATIYYGKESFISFLSEYFKLGRIHFQSRLILYYNLLLLFSFIIILEKIITNKKLFIYLIYSLICYYLFLILFINFKELNNIYFQIITPFIFVLLIFFSFRENNFFTNIRNILILLVAFLSFFITDVGINDLFKSNNKVMSENQKLINCSDIIDNIRRFSINPICQDQNKILNVIDEDYQRYLYISNNSLPQISSLNSKLINVSDMSVYTYGGSPIFPNTMGITYLSEIYGFSNDSPSLNYKFNLDKLFSKDYREFLRWLSIKYLVIEKKLFPTDKLDNISKHYEVLANSNDYLILKDKLSSDFIYITSFNEYEKNKNNFNKFTLTLNFNNFKNQFQGQLYKYYLENKNILNKNYVISDNQQYKGEFSKLNSITINRMQGNKIFLNANCEQKCIIVINNIYLNGYNAIGENRKFEVLPVNYGRIGIVIPEKYNGIIILEYNHFLTQLSVLIYTILILFILFLLL